MPPGSKLSSKHSFARALLAGAGGLASLAGCQDLGSYSTGPRKEYLGCVVPADFVLAGISPTTQMCLTLDANHLQDTPGAISSSDGRFQSTPLRPIPQLWNDPLSTFNFGEGRTKNLLYMATPSAMDGAVSGGDMTVVVSLMEAGGVELRLLRGAPQAPGSVTDGAVPPTNVFAVFPLTLQKGKLRLPQLGVVRRRAVKG